MAFEIETEALETLVENVTTDPVFEGVEPGEEEEDAAATGDEETEGAEEEATEEAEDGSEGEA